MAKKTKKAKTAKTTKAKKTAKKPVPKPTYLEGEEPVDIPVHRVADIFAMLHKHGHAAKFKKHAKAAGVVMSVHPKTVNFVKDFVTNNAMHTDPIGKQVANSEGTYDCTSS